ncbi:MAG: DUF2061 domain-containing protein [Kiritimatiellae bacterium]|nr:DUF2061 domain-containing protein [Kiritimatiellia bacterium]
MKYREELRRRSVLKAVSWRAMGTLGTCLVGWLVTGSLQVGLSISLLDSAIKVFGFYAHERAWHRVTWGLASCDESVGES